MHGVQPLRSGFQQFNAQMRDGACSDRAVVPRVARRFGGREERCAHRLVGVGHQNQRCGGQQRDEAEIGCGVKRQLGVEHFGGCQVAVDDDTKGVVVIRLGHQVGCNIAGCTGPVFHNDGLAQQL